MSTNEFDAVERRRLRRALWRQALGVVAIVVIVGAAALIVTLWIGGSDAIEPRPAALALLLGVWWLWLLRRAPAQWVRIRADLARGEAAELEGTAAVLSRRGFGWLAPSRYRLIVSGAAFDAADFAPEQLRPGERVRLRLAPRSQVLLGVEPAVSVASEQSPSPEPTLSERERQLLALIAEGLTDKLIARRLGLSPATVRTYNSALFKKLGVADRNGAVIYAQRGKGVRVIFPNGQSMPCRPEK